MTDEVNTPAVPDTAPAPEANPAPPAEAPDPSSDTIPKFSVPEEYKDKGWAGKVKSLDDVYKQLDATDALVGKKTVGVPDFEKASPEEVEEYYSKTRPESKDNYSFAEGTPDADKEKFSNLFFENGISKHQADNIIKAYQADEAAQFTEEGALQEMEKALGSNYKEIYAKNNEISKKVFSEDVQGFVDKLPNGAHAMWQKAMSQMAESYGAKESDINVNNDPTPPVVNIDAKRSEIRGKLNELSKRSHSLQEKQDLINQLNDTYKGK